MWGRFPRRSPPLPAAEFVPRPCPRARRRRRGLRRFWPDRLSPREDHDPSDEAAGRILRWSTPVPIGWTRNPMYVGLFFMLCGWAAYLWTWWALPVRSPSPPTSARFQIEMPEEKALSALFGEVPRLSETGCAVGSGDRAGRFDRTPAEGAAPCNARRPSCWLRVERIPPAQGTGVCAGRLPVPRTSFGHEPAAPAGDEPEDEAFFRALDGFGAPARSSSGTWAYSRNCTHRSTSSLTFPPDGVHPERYLETLAREPFYAAWEAGEMTVPASRPTWPSSGYEARLRFLLRSRDAVLAHGRLRAQGRAVAGGVVAGNTESRDPLPGSYVERRVPVRESSSVTGKASNFSPA